MLKQHFNIFHGLQWFPFDEKVFISRVKIVPWPLLAIRMSCQTCHVFTSTKEKEFIIATGCEINQKLPVKSCKQLANCVSLYNLWRLFGAIYVPIQNRVLPSQFVIFHSYISVLRQGVVKTFVSSRISAMHACWKLEVLLKTYLYFVQNRLR